MSDNPEGTLDKSAVREVPQLKLGKDFDWDKHRPKVIGGVLVVVVLIIIGAVAVLKPDLSFIGNAVSSIVPQTQSDEIRFGDTVRPEDGVDLLMLEANPGSALRNGEPQDEYIVIAFAQGTDGQRWVQLIANNGYWGWLPIHRVSSAVSMRFETVTTAPSIYKQTADGSEVFNADEFILRGLLAGVVIILVFLYDTRKEARQWAYIATSLVIYLGYSFLSEERGVYALSTVLAIALVIHATRKSKDFTPIYSFFAVTGAMGLVLGLPGSGGGLVDYTTAVGLPLGMALLFAVIELVRVSWRTLLIVIAIVVVNVLLALLGVSGVFGLVVVQSLSFIALVVIGGYMKSYIDGNGDERLKRMTSEIWLQTAKPISVSGREFKLVVPVDAVGALAVVYLVLSFFQLYAG